MQREKEIYTYCEKLKKYAKKFNDPNLNRLINTLEKKLNLYVGGNSKELGGRLVDRMKGGKKIMRQRVLYQGSFKNAADTFLRKLIQLNRKPSYRNPFEVIPLPKKENRMVIVREVANIIENPKEAGKLVGQMLNYIEEPLRRGHGVEIEIEGESMYFLPKRFLP